MTIFRDDDPVTLTLALVESALQLVPHEIQSHPQIEQYAKRRQKSSGEVLLDRSFHHAAMQRLARTRRSYPVEKMGRPDIVHNTLLQILETPLNWEGHLRTFIHTQDDYVISINPKVRLPKNYLRFVGLVEQLFAEGQVPEKGDALLSLKKMSLQHFVADVKPTRVLAFSKLGRPKLLREVADLVNKVKDPMLLIGGFPRGHFTERTRKVTNEMFKVDEESLDAWVLAGRFVYDFEWSIGLAKNRVKQP